MIWRAIRVLVPVVLLLLLGTPPCVYGCSCVAAAPPRIAFEQASAVFIGTVIAAPSQAAPDAIVSSGDPVQYTFRVSRIWKGPEYTTLVVTTARGSSSCGLGFQEGQAYLVYADGPPEQLMSSLCSRTSRVTSETANETALFGEGIAPSVDLPTSMMPVMADSAAPSTSAAPTNNSSQIDAPLVIWWILLALVAVTATVWQVHARGKRS